MTIDFRLSARERFIAALDKHPKHPITAADVQLGAPVVSIANSRNTRITVTALNPKLTASRTIYYNRLNPQLLIGLGIVLPLTVTLPTDSHGLLEALELQYHIKLVPEDVLLEPVTAGTYNIKIAPGSIGWIGTLDVAVGTIPVDYTHYVMCLDDGSMQMLDNDFILLDDRDIAE